MFPAEVTGARAAKAFTVLWVTVPLKDYNQSKLMRRISYFTRAAGRATCSMDNFRTYLDVLHASLACTVIVQFHEIYDVLISNFRNFFQGCHHLLLVASE